MLASELIKELQLTVEVHGDLEVLTVGCDCMGTAGGAYVEGRHVVISRDEDYEDDEPYGTAVPLPPPPRPTITFKENLLLPDGDREIVRIYE